MSESSFSCRIFHVAQKGNFINELWRCYNIAEVKQKTLASNELTRPLYIIRLQSRHFNRLSSVRQNSIIVGNVWFILVVEELCNFIVVYTLSRAFYLELETIGPSTWSFLVPLEQ